MHHSALANAARFFAAYPMPGATVVDIGAQDIQGSLRDVCPHAAYVGVDFIEGRGVDVVLTDPYVLPFADNSQDIIVSSSVFEHSEFFWLLFEEIARVLKPGGLFYLNVPANGDVHRHPVDCWRFYPDSGPALVAWAQRQGHAIELLEHYTSNQRRGIWNDYVAVFAKTPHTHAGRITADFQDFRNGWSGTALKATPFPEEQSGLISHIRHFLLSWEAGTTRFQRKPAL